MYHVMTEKQLLLLHPGKEDKTRNLLAYLVRQNRVWQVGDFYLTLYYLRIRRSALRLCPAAPEAHGGQW